MIRDIIRGWVGSLRDARVLRARRAADLREAAQLRQWAADAEEDADYLELPLRWRLEDDAESGVSLLASGSGASRVRAEFGLRELADQGFVKRVEQRENEDRERAEEDRVIAREWRDRADEIERRWTRDR